MTELQLQHQPNSQIIYQALHTSSASKFFYQPKNTRSHKILSPRQQKQNFNVTQINLGEKCDQHLQNLIYHNQLKIKDQFNPIKDRMAEVRSASSGRKQYNYKKMQKNVEKSKDSEFFGLYQTLQVNKIKPSEAAKQIKQNFKIHEIDSNDDGFKTRMEIFESDYLNDRDITYISNEMSYAYKRGNDELDSSEPKTDSKNKRNGRRTIMLGEGKNKTPANQVKVIKPQIQIETNRTKNIDSGNQQKIIHYLVDNETQRNDETFKTGGKLNGTINLDIKDSIDQTTEEIENYSLPSPEQNQKYLSHQSSITQLRENKNSRLVIDKKSSQNSLSFKASPKFERADNLINYKIERARSSNITSRVDLKTDLNMLKINPRSRMQDLAAVFNTCKNVTLSYENNSLSNSSNIDENTKILITSKPNDPPQLVYQNMTTEPVSRFNPAQNYLKQKLLSLQNIETLSEGIKGVSLQKNDGSFNNLKLKFQIQRKSSVQENSDIRQFSMSNMKTLSQSKLRIANLRIQTKLKTHKKQQKKQSSQLDINSQNKSNMNWFFNDAVVGPKSSKRDGSSPNRAKEAYYDDNQKIRNINLKNLECRSKTYYLTIDSNRDQSIKNNHVGTTKNSGVFEKQRINSRKNKIQVRTNQAKAKVVENVRNEKIKNGVVKNVKSQKHIEIQNPHQVFSQPKNERFYESIEHFKNLKNCPKSQKAILSQILRKGRMNDALDKVNSQKSFKNISNINEKGNFYLPIATVPNINDVKFNQQQMRINNKLMRTKQKEAISETIALKAQKIIENELKLQKIKMNEIQKNQKKRQIYQKYIAQKIVPYSPMKNQEIQSPMKNMMVMRTEFGTSHRYF